MLINSSLYLTFTIVLPVLLMIGSIILVKRKFNNYYGAVIGIIVSAFLFAFLEMGAGRVYVIFDNKDYTGFRVLGSTDYKLNNGKIVQLGNVNHTKITVINNSSKTVVIDEIKYRTESAIDMSETLEEIFRNMEPSDSVSEAQEEEEEEENEIVIPPGEHGDYYFRKQKIDYFFDDDIPREVEEYGSGNTTKYWLRYK